MKQFYQKHAPMGLVFILALIVVIETGILIGGLIYYQTLETISDELQTINIIKSKPTTIPNFNIPNIAPTLVNNTSITSNYQPDYPKKNGWIITQINQNNKDFPYSDQLEGKLYLYKYSFNNINEKAEIDFIGHYMKLLDDEKWSQHLQYASAGVQGMTIGYKKNLIDGESVIILSERNKGPWSYEIGPPKLNCPCEMEYSFFIGKRIKT